MDIANLQGQIPDDVYRQLIDDVLQRFNLNSALRLAHFLAQCDYESATFRYTEENLNYSAERLITIFPNYFNAVNAAAYARKPKDIANKVYANRMGNGNEASGDGWRYRGRGYIQLTFKNNYRAFGEYLGLDIENLPDEVASVYPLLSGAYFFEINNLFTKADEGSSHEVVSQITRKVSGSTRTASERYNRFLRYYGLLNSILAFHLTGTLSITPENKFFINGESPFSEHFSHTAS
jgi:putative chitinase